MKKEVKYIWIVERQNIHANGTKGSKSHSYFSSREKAELHVKWLCACAENNNAFRETWNDADLSAEYRLTNGDMWLINTERKALDLDDLFIGEA